MTETLKIQVRRTITEEAEIDIPLYAEWFDDVADGRLSYETRIYINEKMELRSITNWIGETSKWEFEFQQLKPEQLGQYLKYDRIGAAEFEEWAAKIAATLG